MTLEHALKLVVRIHEGDCSPLLRGLCEHTNGEYTFGARRESTKTPVSLRASSLETLGTAQLFTLVNGVQTPFPFKVADLVANDWECFRYSTGLKSLETFKDYLLRIHGASLFSHDEAYRALLEQDESGGIRGVEIQSIFEYQVASVWEGDCGRRYGGFISKTDIVPNAPIIDIDEIHALLYGLNNINGELFTIRVVNKAGGVVPLLAE